MKVCLSPRETDIVWRFKHGALCTPKLALQLGLRDSSQCFFCTATCPTWRHIIICDSFRPMWNVIIGIINRAGCEWKHLMHFEGISVKKFLRLKSIIHAGYLVIHEYCCFEMNNLPFIHQPSTRVRQVIFEMIYSEFKAQAADSFNRFHFEWEILDFLFKVCGRSIDIRIP